MGKYSKAIGAIVGGLVGVAAVALGWTDATGTINPALQPAVDAVVTAILSMVGTYWAPKNAE